LDDGSAAVDATGDDDYSASISGESNVSKVTLPAFTREGRLRSTFGGWAFGRSGLESVRRRLKPRESLQSWSSTELGNAHCSPIPELEMVWQSR
jgi:hypothetical protein